MGSIGPSEVIIVLVVALIVLGPNRLPDAARQVGKALGELKRMSSGFQEDMREAFQDGAEPPTGIDRPRATPEAGPVAGPIVESQPVDVTNDEGRIEIDSAEASR